MAPNDTIFALATAPGRAGVAVMRLSGPLAGKALEALRAGPLPAPRLALLRKLYSPNGDLLDQALVLWFPAPHSFTGEDVLELHLHGSRAVIQELSALLAGLPGLRLAEPGEFARRAFLNGKMDLTAAEGLADLIDAETHAQKQQALRLMGGELEQFYSQLRQRVIHSLALCEAYIDFPDEDLPDHVLSDLLNEIENLKATIAGQLNDGKRGQKIRDGIDVVIIGPPNAGKSSLLNALARRDVAIVSSQAGTTRDIIEVHLDIAGYAVTIADTAGLRVAKEEVEEEGIRRALARSKRADITIALFDAAEWPHLDQKTLAEVDERTIIVFNKSDLREEDIVFSHADRHALLISVKENRGLDLLLGQIEIQIAELFSVREAPRITRLRHRKALEAAQSHLDGYGKVEALELQCEELRQTARAIGSITGQIDVEQVLDDIFFHFCIGK